MKDEIGSNEISKHIEIINYMHKTEIAHINKRYEQQIDAKDSQIDTLEQKLEDAK